MEYSNGQVNRRSYRIPEVAEATGLSIGMVRKEIEVGRLHKVKIGRAVVVLAEDLERWLQASNQTADQSRPATT